MNITVMEDHNLSPTEVILKCHTRTTTIDRLCDYAKKVDATIMGILDDKQYPVNVTDIYYFESVDKETFLYSDDHVMNCNLRLYELETQLETHSFVRISKSVLVNLMKVKNIRPLINRNLCLELNNGENVICSRRYVNLLKKTLEMRRS